MFDRYQFCIFFYNLELECDNAYEVGKTPVSPFISLEICFVIPVRLAFLCEESFSEQAVGYWPAAGLLASGAYMLSFMIEMVQR